MSTISSDGELDSPPFLLLVFFDDGFGCFSGSTIGIIFISRSLVSAFLRSFLEVAVNMLMNKTLDRLSRYEQEISAVTTRNKRDIINRVHEVSQDVLIDIFYDTITPADEEEEEMDEDLPVVPPHATNDDKKSHLRTVNPELYEFIIRKEYERAHDETKRTKAQMNELRDKMLPKRISPAALQRMFNALQSERCYAAVKRLANTLPCGKVQGDEGHPVTNISMECYFDPVLFERYIGCQILPTVTKHIDSALVHSRYSIMAYAFVVTGTKCTDVSVEYAGKHATFKSVLFNLLNGIHIKRDHTVIENFATPPSVICNSNEQAAKLLKKVWQASKNAAYLIAINYSTETEARVTRFDSAANNLMSHDVTGSPVLRLDSESDFFYDNRHGGGWLYTVNNTCHYDTLIERVLDCKINNLVTSEV